MIKRAIRLLAVSFLVLPALLLSACTPSLTTEELISRATAALESRDYSAAELDLKTVLQTDPDNAMARYLYSRIYLYRQDGEAALSELERSLASENLPETRLLLAQTLTAMGEHAELVSDAEAGRFASVEANPEFQAALARAYLNLVEYEAARGALERASGEGNDYVDVTRALFAMRLDSDPVRADALLAQVTERDPYHARAWSLRGLLANQARDHEAAESHFSNAVDANPNRLTDRLRLVEARIEQGKAETASEVLQGLEKQIPDYPEVNYLRGRLFFDAGDYENAIDSLARALSVDSDHPGALILSAYANTREQNLDTARRQFTQYLTLRPDNVEARVQLADVWWRLGDMEQTEAAAREILEEHTMNVRALTLLAAALAAQGMHAESAQTFEKIAALAPDSLEAQIELGSQLLAAGNVDSGIRQLESVVAANPESSIARERLIEARIALRDLDAAALAAQAYVDQEPGSEKAAVYLGNVWLQQGDSVAATQQFERALTLEPGDTAAAGGVAAVAMMDEDLAAAEAALRAVLAEKPGDLKSSLNLVVVLEKLGRTDEIEAVLRTAVQANPNALTPRLALARIAQVNGRPGEVIELLSEAEAAYPENALLQQSLAQAFLALNELDAAETRTRRLMELRPNAVGALFIAARVEAAQGRPEAAQLLLEKGLGIQPQAQNLRGLLIDVLASQGKLDQAGAELEKLPSAMQNQIPVVVLRGRIAASKGDFASAESYFTEAFSRRETSIHLALLASSYWQLGKRDEAVNALASWLEEHPTDPLIRNDLASMYLRLEREDDATREYEALLDLQPDNVIALNNLGWLLRNDDGEQAIAYVEKASELAPDNAAVKDTYAMILLEAGDAEQALRLNERALDLVPGNPDLMLNRSKILLGLERSDEAITILRELVSGPLFAGQDEARELLSAL